MTSVVTPSISSATTDQPTQLRRLTVYLTESDTEASDTSSTHSSDPSEGFWSDSLQHGQEPAAKRRKVAREHHKPVWIKVEPDSHIKTHSVITQWQPSPPEHPCVHWNKFVRKLELRSRHIDICNACWKPVTDLAVPEEITSASILLDDCSSDLEDHQL